MVRPIAACLGVLLLLVGWLGLLTYQVQGDVPALVVKLSESAWRVHLPGLTARGYLLAASLWRDRLQQTSPASPDYRVLLQQIITARMAAARSLLKAGYKEAAERVALEGARADFGNVAARALLLEVRLQGDQNEAARRELMLMLLKREDPQVLYLLGQSFIHSGQHDDGEAYLDRALALAPDHLPTLRAKLDLALTHNDKAAASKWATRALTATTDPLERASLRAAQAPRDLEAVRLETVRLWFSDHGVSVLLATAYLVFLFTPTFFSLFKRLLQLRITSPNDDLAA